MEALYQKMFRRSISSEAVTWAYRLFLDREPENSQVVEEKTQGINNTAELRKEFLTSDEFKQKNPPIQMPTLSGDEAPMEIEDVRSEKELKILFDHVQETWQHLGETEPHWSVLSSEQFLSANIQNNMDSFYSSGKKDITHLFKTLERSQVNYQSYTSCLEYGCGLGRVTRWLAEKFGTVYGYDISKSHLLGAENSLREAGINNVSLKHVNQVKDIQELPRVDLVYCVIVLQHNPPPLIGLMIREFIQALNVGGVAFFQVPTYRPDYQFHLNQYLKAAPYRQIEMHVFPQRRIFEIIGEEHGQVLEVLEDTWAGLHYKELSNSFLVKKIKE